MNLSLSPTLFAICNRSKAFRRRFRYDQLNVCNVVRSFVYVMLFKNILFPGLAFLVANSVVQLIYVMFLYGSWDPFTSSNYIAEAWRNGPDFVWTSFSHWFTTVSMCLSLMVALFGTIIVIGAPTLFVIVYAFIGISKLLKTRVHGDVIETVLTPLSIGFEWMAARHNRFCVNVNATVRTRTTYKDHLEAAHKEELMKYKGRIRKMSLPELASSVESTRATLANFKL